MADRPVNPLGDLPPDELRAVMHQAADKVADYLAGVGELPVLPPTQPGDVARALPSAPPASPEPMDAVLADFDRLVVPNNTQWNHPAFFAYIAITASAPGIVGETLAAALNVNAMLWRTSPVATELEERVCDWVRQMMGLPEGFRGHMNDTASIGVLLALAAARDRAVPDVRDRGLQGAPQLAVYTSDQAHSSLDKAAITLGLGLHAVRRVPSDEAFRMDVAALRRAIEADRAAGVVPLVVLATAGTTSTGSLDPLDAVADAAEAAGAWFHVDAAYGGGAMVVPEVRAALPGIERADSVVVNPHKWLFTPVDCSILLLRAPERLKAAFSLVPPYLATTEAGVTNLMDYGPQLGRRFRALKLWMVLRAFGVDGIRERIAAHLALARQLAGWVDADAGFVRVAPVTLGIVAFRALSGAGDEADDALNRRVRRGEPARAGVPVHVGAAGAHRAARRRGEPADHGGARAARVDEVREVAAAQR
ncbi:MAG: aminotransferase class I/II-fold pyridoxal phosphate-dependent enzyme [Myxococcota bacterium]